MRRRSFTVRLTLGFAGVALAGAALTALLVNLAFGARFTSYLEQQQRTSQERLVAALTDSWWRAGGWDTADLARVDLVDLLGGGELILLDPEGRVLWQASGSSHDGMGEMHQRMMATALGPTRRLPMRAGGTTVGTAVVRLPAVGAQPADRALRAAVNRLLVLGGLVAALVAVALGLVLARRATAPARALTRAAGALAAGDRSQRLTVGGADEFGQMAGAFNLLADRIESEDRLRRAFAASVAHELRTPLAILRSQVEAIQDGVVDAGPDTLASLHEEVLRTSRLVDDLETLASAEAAGFALQHQPVALRPLLAQAVGEFTGLFAVRRIKVETRLADLVVAGDSTRLRQVASNLLSNALKFTPPGGWVRVELTGEDGQAVLRVADSGPGIPPEELPRVFDRFFRGSGVRAGGSGIGLAVVRELVAAHGGSVEATSPPGAGAAFTVRLPGASNLQRSFTAPSHHTATVQVEGGEQR
jgi:two-component system, OmpR family, sensor histidine kinase BaeS